MNQLESGVKQHFVSRQLLIANRPVTSREHLLNDSASDPLITAEVVNPPQLSYVDRDLQRVTDRLEPTSGSAGWGNTVQFRLNQSDVDFLKKLVLKFQTSAVTVGVNCVMVPATSMFQRIEIKVGGHRLLEIENPNTILIDDEVHADVNEDAEKTVVVKNSSTNVGTGGSAGVVDYQIELNRNMPWNKKLFPINKQILSQDIYISFQFVPATRAYDTSGGGAAVTGGDPQNVYLLQESYNDSGNKYLPFFRTQLAAGHIMTYPYVYSEDHEVILSGADSNHRIDFANRTNIKEIIFFVQDSNSFVDYDCNPIADANDITDFYLQYNGTRYYPNKIDNETTQENLYTKRALSGAYPTGRNFYRINFEEDFISNSENANDHGIGFGHIDNTRDPKPRLYITGGAANDRLYIVVLSRRAIRLMPSKTVEIIEG